jgi:hypothetical protein
MKERACLVSKMAWAACSTSHSVRIQLDLADKRIKMLSQEALLRGRTADSRMYRPSITYVKRSLNIVSVIEHIRGQAKAVVRAMTFGEGVH